MKIEVIKGYDKKSVVYIDGIMYDTHDISKMIKTNRSSVCTKLYRNSEETFISWLYDRLWMVKHNIAPKCHVYKRNKERSVVRLVMEKSGINETSARTRLNKWVRYEMSTEELYAPPSERKIEEKTKADWGGLSSKKRDHKIKEIPNPSKFERKKLGKPVGSP